MSNPTQVNFVIKNGLTVGNTAVISSNGVVIGAVANTGVQPGIYGGSSQIPVITVGADGRLSTAANVTVNIPSGTLVYANSGQLTSNSVSGTGNVLLGLATTGVSAGYYGGVTSYPVISVDQYGRITSVVNVASSTSNTAIFTNVDEFTANGTGTTFALTATPFNANNVLININGVTQQKPTFSLSGTTLILTEPPVNGATVEVAYSYNSNNMLLVANTTVTPGTYGGSTNIPVLVINQYGQVTSASNTSIYVPPGTAVFANSGQLTSNSATGTGNVLLGLATTGTAGTYANANTVAVITTDAYGRVSAVTNTAIQIAIAQVTGLQGVTDSQNTNTTAAGSYANSAFTAANSAGAYANSAFSTANSSGLNAISAGAYANSAYTQANTATTNAAAASSYANSAFTTANSAGVYANGAYGAANASFGAANSAGSYANSAFTTANSKFSSSGGTISGNVTISGSLSVTGNITYTGNVINQTITGNTGQFFGEGANGFGALYAGIPTGYALEPQTVIQSTGNYNDYVQINLQNLNNGVNATADYTATSDNGTVNDGYIDIGITSSTYSNPTYNLFGPNDGYVYAAGNTTTGGGNLIFYTNTPKDIVFAANGAGTGNEIARFKYNTGLVLKSLPITFADSTTQNTAAAPFSFSNSIFVQANAAFSRANTSANSFSGTNGTTATPTNGSISFASNNGVLISGTSNIVSISTAQDLRTSASPTFVSLTLTNPLTVANGGTGVNSFTANTISYYNGSTLASLANVSTVGVYGNSTSIPSITVDGYGRVVAVSNNAVSTTINISGTTGTGSVSGGGTLTFLSNNGVVVSAAGGSTLYINSPQDLRTSASPSFTALTVNTAAYVSSTVYTTGNLSQNTVDSFSVSTYRSAKYQAQMTSGSAYHMIELNVISDGTNPLIAQYGEIFTSASLGTFDVSLTAGTLYLLFTPTNSVTTVKLLRTAITV